MGKAAKMSRRRLYIPARMRYTIPENSIAAPAIATAIRAHKIFRAG